MAKFKVGDKIERKLKDGQVLKGVVTWVKGNKVIATHDMYWDGDMWSGFISPRLWELDTISYMKRQKESK